MATPSQVAYIYEKILELCAGDALDVYMKALKGEKLTQHQMDAAKEIMGKIPQMQPQQSSSITVSFDGLPRPSDTLKNIGPNAGLVLGTGEKEKEGVVVPASNGDLSSKGQ